MKDLTAAGRVLLSLVSHSLFNREAILPDKVEWGAVIKEADEQAVLPVALYSYVNIRSLEREYPALKSKMAGALSNNVRVSYHHAKLSELMEANGIQYVILKGCASARYYPEPLCRAMGDVDFLVSPKDLTYAGQILEKEGFKQCKEKHLCHIIYKSSEAHLEMHFEPSGVPEGKAGDRVRAYLGDVFQTSVKAEVGGAEMRVPDDFHHGLILLLHTCHHLTGEGVGLRHICDWAVFANSLSDDRFCELFEEKLKAVGLWRFAQLLTQLSVKYLGMPAKEWAMREVDEGLLRSMICDIFEGGNFGAKDSQRMNEAKIISNRGKNGVDDSLPMGKQLFLNMNNIVYLKWSAAKRYKILLPFGWIFFGTRHLFRIAVGKRASVNIKKTVEGAKERRELYKQFHLYEV